MTDRELLELAAKAAGLEWLSYHHQKGLCCRDKMTHGGLIEYYWNPLKDDGDALRLAVKMRMQIDVISGETRCKAMNGTEYINQKGGGSLANTRRAIARAAADWANIFRNDGITAWSKIGEK